MQKCTWLLLVLSPHGCDSFYHATACNATHGIAVEIPSVSLSVRCMYYDKTK